MKKHAMILALVLIAGGCVTTGSFTYKGTIKEGAWLRGLTVPYTSNGKEYKGRLQIYFPKGYKRGEAAKTLIVLHGYDGSMRDWEKQTTIERYANTHGFVLVCPAMGKSIYASRYYNETKRPWAPIPGGEYMAAKLIPYLQKTFSLCSRKEGTGIMGLSTGGRGALLLAAAHPEHFGAAAGLSGDYDPLSMTRNRLLTAVYGPYKNFKERWEQDDNLMTMATSLEDVPVFLTHGGKDYIVPREQSMLLAMKLRQLQYKGGNYKVTYREFKHSVHDWKFWRRVLPEIMEFFGKNLK